MLQKLGHTCCKSCYTNFRKDFTEILHKECIATAVPQVGADVQIATDIEAACAPLARCDAAIAQVGLPLGLIPSKRRDRAAVATVYGSNMQTEANMARWGHLHETRLYARLH